MEIAEKIKKWLGTGSINIFGPPFAGKDTHGHRLAKQLDAVLMGGGEILRGVGIPSQVKELHRTGRLFPSDVYFSFVLPYLQQTKFDGKAIILSSVGRSKGEETVVLQAAAEAGHPIKAVVYLNVDESVIWDRWEHSDSHKNRGNREDDSKEALKIRLTEFKNKTLPVIDFYRQQGLLIEVDSNRAKDTVSGDILESLLKFSETA